MPNAILFFCESIAMGFVMAAPVGPVGVLCLRRVLKSGWMAGFITGFAVAVCDAFFGLVSSLGLSSVSGLFLKYEQPIRLIGGVILLAIGWQIFRSTVPQPHQSTSASDDDEDSKHEAAEKSPRVPLRRYFKYFFSALILALTNPLAIFSFAAVYVSLGMGTYTADHPMLVINFVIGILVGSSLWWWFLSITAFKLKDRFTHEKLVYVNKGCAVVIAIFGLVSLGTFVKHLGH